MERFIDVQAETGRHRYRVIPRLGEREGFPAVAMAFPRGASRTFLRGDSNSDDRVSISDPVSIIKLLFLNDPLPTCLDAADVDDSGSVSLSDAMWLLQHLFEGGKRLPSPGSRTPWFDPTPDDLPCNLR